MKYYLMNKQEVLKDINTNPILIKTKSLSKIKKYRTLLAKVNKLRADIEKELKLTNTAMTDEKIEMVLNKDGEELTSSEFNSMYAIPLYDDELQRIRAYNKTKVMHGKLVGTEIILDKGEPNGSKTNNSDRQTMANNVYSCKNLLQR